MDQLAVDFLNEWRAVGAPDQGFRQCGTARRRRRSSENYDSQCKFLYKNCTMKHTRRQSKKVTFSPLPPSSFPPSSLPLFPPSLGFESLTQLQDHALPAQKIVHMAFSFFTVANDIVLLQPLADYHHRLLFHSTYRAEHVHTATSSGKADDW